MTNKVEVQAIYRYPVKSLRGHALKQSHVEPIGLQGDRRWMVVDEAGQFQTIRQIPKMVQIDAQATPSGLRLSDEAHGSCEVGIPGADRPTMDVKVWRDSLQARLAAAEAAVFLSHALGKAVHLVYMADTDSRPVNPQYRLERDRVSFADGFPLLLVTTDSLDDLGRRLGATPEVLRFRPNLVIRGAKPWEEDTWKEIGIGTARFRVVKPCPRCVVTTRNPFTGEQADPSEPLRTLARFHRSADGGVIFGQNLIPDSAGTIQAGDKVEILRAGDSNLN